jgi:secernin
MGRDAVVALGRASIDGQTLFGQTSPWPTRNCQPLCLIRGRTFAPGEKVNTEHLELPQAHHTYTVLGSRSMGCWGYEYGLNEHQVAIGCTDLPPAIRGQRSGLLGTDLVRLGLEQSRSARHAAHLLTHLIEDCGQCCSPGGGSEADHDSAFLIADPNEAYVIETAGKYWVLQEIQEVRAQSAARVIRQDWDRICHGLADWAIERGCWPDDGSKLDFAAALAEKKDEDDQASRRWSRISLLLQEQTGHIDLSFLRHILNDEDGDRLDSGESQPKSRVASASGEGPSGTRASTTIVATLSSDPGYPPMAWCGLGTPWTVFFPVFLDGELPETLSQMSSVASAPNWGWRVDLAGKHRRPHGDAWESARESLARLQARFDRETEEFLLECAAIRKKGFLADLGRQASLFMEHHVEQLEEVVGGTLRSSMGAPTAHFHG